MSGAFEPSGFDPRRAVQVITTRGAGAGRRGSGYQVTGDMVLTAAHVVGDAVSVQVRFLAENGEAAETPGESVWIDSTVDIALLKIASGPGTGGLSAVEVSPTRFARLTGPVACEALGFPRFRLRPDTASPDRDASASYRDSHHARGDATPWSYLRAGSLEVCVGAPEYDPVRGRSPWEGMSGAAVWSGGCVIGVVSEHHRSDGLGRLAASRVDRWYERLAPAQINELNTLIGLPTSAGQLEQLPPPEPPRVPPWLREAAEYLAVKVDAQWRHEERRRVHDPFPLNVRFRRPADTGLFDHEANIQQVPPGANPRPLVLDGQGDQIVKVYQSIRSGRLVVLGDAGSGKTILALRFVLGWLGARAPGVPVPVIFGLGSWDPTAVSLRDWMCGQLVRDYPGLAAPAVHEGNLAGALVDAGRILPVLDGFDEIASGLHRAALIALNATTVTLLLTSRPTEYAKAVAEAGVLTAAAGIGLEDLTLDDFADYLRRASPPRPNSGGGLHSTAWEPVLAQLSERARGPGAVNVAAALTTPLMVALARTVYRGARGHGPAELLDTTRFPTSEALQDHLLAAFVPAAYDTPPADRGAGRPRCRRWNPERAQHWLGYLAHHLDQRGTRDLGWWELGTAMRRSSRMLVIGLLAGLAFGVTTAVGNLPVDLVGTAYGLTFALVRGLVIGLLHGLAAGLAFGLAYGFVSGGAGREPSRVRIQIFGETRQRRGRFFPRFKFGLGYGFVAALVLESVDRLVVASLGLGDGLDGGLVGGLMFGPLVGLGAGLVAGLIAWLEVPIDISSAVSPSDLLHTNRKNVVFHLLVCALVFGLGAGLPVGLGAGLVNGFTAGPVFGLQVGLVFGLEAAFGGGLGYGLSLTAWGQWVALARMCLPLTGRLPWALVAFLDDACQRGVLRQAGAVYQFRHARLQDHLVQVFQARQDQTPVGSC